MPFTKYGAGYKCHFGVALIFDYMSNLVKLSDTYYGIAVFGSLLKVLKLWPRLLQHSNIFRGYLKCVVKKRPPRVNLLELCAGRCRRILQKAQKSVKIL